MVYEQVSKIILSLGHYSEIVSFYLEKISKKYNLSKWISLTTHQMAARRENSAIALLNTVWNTGHENILQGRQNKLAIWGCIKLWKGYCYFSPGNEGILPHECCSNIYILYISNIVYSSYISELLGCSLQYRTLPAPSAVLFLCIRCPKRFFCKSAEVRNLSELFFLLLRNVTEFHAQNSA
jgi:hypothetical protein